MLHFISIARDDTADEAHRLKILEKVNVLGECYRCADGIFFLYTDLNAGLVDAALRSVLGHDTTFVVLDITGISQEQYFGRVPMRASGERCWDWVRQHLISSS